MVSLRGILEDCRRHSRASDYVLIALDLLTIKLDEAIRQQLDADVSKVIH